MKDEMKGATVARAKREAGLCHIGWPKEAERMKLVEAVIFFSVVERPGPA
jgi:NADH:ubiquinone oxidoreductase subunit D